MTDASTILALNAGSSSVKFAGFDRNLRSRFRGKLEGIGTHPKLTVTTREADGRIEQDWSGPGAENVTVLIHRLIAWIERHEPAGDLAASAAGHGRVGDVRIGGVDREIGDPGADVRRTAQLPVRVQ